MFDYQGPNWTISALDTNTENEGGCGIMQKELLAVCRERL
jgi:hypothetical protein